MKKIWIKLLSLILTLSVIGLELSATVFAQETSVAETIELTVMTPHGDKNKISITKDATVKELKEDVAKTFNVAFAEDSEYRLYSLDAKDSELSDDEKTLKDEGFETEDTIWLESSGTWDASEKPIQLFGLTIKGGKGCQSLYGNVKDADFYWDYYYKTITLKTDTSITISGIGETDANIIINTNKEYADLTISNLTLTESTGACININPDSWLKLTLTGKSTFTSSGQDDEATIALSSNNSSLLITENSEGTLNVKSEIEGVSAIGTSNDISEYHKYADTKSLEIKGGTITATGGEEAYGIRAFNLLISGGNVTAEGGIDVYDIPPDDFLELPGKEGSFEISGGTVKSFSENGKALSKVPDLTNYIGYKAIASTSTVGSDTEEYDSSQNDEYKYFEISSAYDKNDKIFSIAINSTTHKIDYLKNEPLDVTNLTILVTYTNGTSETVPVTEDMVSGFNSSEHGLYKKLIITYKGHQCFYYVHIINWTVRVYKMGLDGTYPETYTVNKFGEASNGWSMEAIYGTGKYAVEGFTRDEELSVVSGKIDINNPYMILKIYLARNQYKLAFNDTDGTVYREEMVYYEVPITKPEDPTKEGFVFDGWGEVAATMPAADVTYTAKWKVDEKSDEPSNPGTVPPTYSGSSSTSKKYRINVEETEFGEVESSHKTAKRGDIITLTVLPDAEFALDTVKVVDKNGDEIELEDNGDGTFSFKMPRSSVTVTGVFDDGIEEDQTTIVLTIDSRIIWVDEEMIVYDVAPVIRNDRTVLPIRVIVEALGATAIWNETEQKVTITKGDAVIELFINLPYALVNGEPVQLDTPAFIENNRTYLPLRFVMENIGAEVTWDDLTRTVTVVG